MRFVFPFFLIRFLDGKCVFRPVKKPSNNLQLGKWRVGTWEWRVGLDDVPFQLHPQSLTWNLKMIVSKRNLLFHFRCHDKFQGCRLFLGSKCEVSGWESDRHCWANSSKLHMKVYESHPKWLWLSAAFRFWNYRLYRYLWLFLVINGDKFTMRGWYG